MTDIRPLTTLNLDSLLCLMTGYTSDTRYQARIKEAGEFFAIELELVSLPQPYRKRWDQPDDEMLANYRQAAASGFSFGAYDGGEPVGIILAEPHRWNNSLWVWELHVARAHRRRGIGRQLVEALAVKARANGFRIIVCETQNTNVPAIHFYRQAGFTIEGIDLSYYSNDDFPDGEIALFMKMRLT